MKYQYTIPDTPRNLRIALAILGNFAGVEAELVTLRAATLIQLSTDSEATWTATVAAFEDSLEET